MDIIAKVIIPSIEDNLFARIHAVYLAAVLELYSSRDEFFSVFFRMHTPDICLGQNFEIRAIKGRP